MRFADHFSEKSHQYARARPRYPEAVYAFVAAQAPATERAWDCASGNGQAAEGLARHFRQVEATDASGEQIRNAAPIERVRFSVQAAEETDFAVSSFDAICVAQALHWLDLDRFYAEARRVLKPGGVIAAWGYDRMRTSDLFQARFDEEILPRLKPYWPAQNRLLWSGYEGIPFPFERIAAPAFEMRVQWTLQQLRAYVETWSGTRGCLAALGADALDAAWSALQVAWGGAREREFVMPMHFLCGRHGSR
jgi:SAM-dependent methyltransferase